MLNSNMKVVKAPKSLFFVYFFSFTVSVVLFSFNYFTDSQNSAESEQIFFIIYILQAVSLMSIFLYSTIDTLLQTKDNYSRGIKWLRNKTLKMLILVNLIIGAFTSYQYGLIEVLKDL